MAIADELIAILGYEIEGEELVRRYEQSLDRVNQRLNKFAATAGRVAGAAAATLATGFGLLGRSVTQTSAEFEVYQATLETIEGSADKARQSLDWIAEFGKTTPYDVAQVTEAFVALKAYGIDPIADDALRTLGDTASAMGKPLSQAVEAFADAATGEFERLKEFGIRAKQQGDEVTFSWTQNGEEMTRTVQKSSNEIRAFLLETMGDRFTGAMERQSKTWTGMMSNLGDTWTDFQRRIGDAGFFDNIKGKLETLLTWLGRLDQDGTLDRWAQGLSDALSKTADIFGAVAERIGQNVVFLIDNWEHLQTPMMIVGALFAILVARAFPLITLFSLLALVVDDVLAYMQGGESIIGDFIQKIQDLTGVSEGVAQAIAGLGGTVLAALAAAFLFAPGKVIKIFGRLLFTGLAALAPLILKGAAAAFALLSNPIGWAILLAGVAIGLIYYFWDEIKAAWDATKDKAIEIFSSLKDWILEIDWAGLGTDMMNAIWNGMKAVGQMIVDWFDSLIPDWARPLIDEITGNDSGPGAVAVPREITSRPLTEEERAAFAAEREPVTLTDDAWEAKLQMQAEEWARVNGNIERMMGDLPVDATITDARQDNREFPFESNVTINQTVTQATDAPAAAASATGTAVSNTVAGQRAEIEAEPSMQ